MRKTLMLMIVMAAMALSVGLTADTYNFFFSKKKEKQKTEEQEQNDDEDNEDKKREKSSDSSKSSEDKVEVQKGQQPIVINNINNNDNSNRNNLTNTPTMGGAPPPPSLSAEIVLPTKEYPRWRWTLGASASSIEQGSALAGYEIGGNYRVNQRFGWSLYAGSREVTNLKPYAGFDMELLPVRIAITESWNFVEGGLLAGVSTLAAVNGNIGSIHIGAKAALNFTENIGLTSSFRINYGYKALTLALICQL